MQPMIALSKRDLRRFEILRDRIVRFVDDLSAQHNGADPAPRRRGRPAGARNKAKRSRATSTVSDSPSAP